MKPYVAALALSLLTSGCATQVFNMQVNSGAKPELEETHHFVISGFGQTKTVNAGQVCGGASRVGRVESTVTALDALFGTLSAGMYTPHTVRVYCAVK